MGVKRASDGKSWRAQLQAHGDRCYNGAAHLDPKQAQFEHFM